jgi:hypothetical protein
VTRDGQEVELRGKGRHDPCVLPRAVPMVESMMALTLLDHLLLQTAQCDLFPNTLPNRPNPLGKTAKRADVKNTNGVVTPAVPVTAGAAVSQRIDEE